jgi:hypothetical protein
MPKTVVAQMPDGSESVFVTQNNFTLVAYDMCTGQRRWSLGNGHCSSATLDAAPVIVALQQAPNARHVPDDALAAKSEAEVGSRSRSASTSVVGGPWIVVHGFCWALDGNGYDNGTSTSVWLVDAQSGVLQAQVNATIPGKDLPPSYDNFQSAPIQLTSLHLNASGCVDALIAMRGRCAGGVYAQLELCLLEELENLSFALS